MIINQGMKNDIIAAVKRVLDNSNAATRIMITVSADTEHVPTIIYTIEELVPKADGKESPKKILEGVKKIIDENSAGMKIAPVQLIVPEDKKTKTDKIKPKNEKKAPKSELNAQKPEKESKPKKEWNEEQKRDIALIKQAHKAKRQEVKSEKIGNKRTDIDDTLIVYMRDEQHRTIKQIANEIGCCQQTVLNRYNRAKRDAEKGGGKK